MSMMLLEAASLGVPIIAGDIKENRDIFTDDEILFFRTNDVEDLALKIDWALRHYEEMAKKAQLAKIKLRDHYSWDIICKQYKDVFESLLR